ncbi:MAG: GTPase domain-containing protein [Lyngbya sp.]|nr:GTPase domain-containing protein [Lyngbya sp.]
MPAGNAISPLLNNIIQERGKQVRIIEQYLENINQIDGAIQELRDALNHLLQHPQVTDELKSRLQEFGTVSSSWTEEITSAITRLENGKNRFARQAVTIGCSGQARVGKSTLLQTIGNLPEEAIPTGKGIPVTAVRSRLRHSSESKAILSLRDKKTFLDELIKPFHRELNLPVINSFEDFRNFDYSSDLATDQTVALLGRLKQMQAALSSYENHLTGRTKIIEDLTELRPWVAYPKQEEEINLNCSRLYLAVKNVEIQCSFLLDVEQLMLVDLPGLGEVNVDAEEHHIQGLRNEVDLVLLILRPTAQSSFWGDKDGKALNLISQAVEGVSKLGDFVIVVVNHGDNDDKELYQMLINDINKQLNENQPNSRYKLLTCNAKDPNRVREELLIPVLNHLIERLPVMDKEIIDSSVNQWQGTLEKIRVAIDELAISLRMFPAQGSRDGNVFQKAKTLRAKLAVELGKEIKELRKEVQTEKDEGSIIDRNLIEAIEEKHQHIQTWVENGLGEGEEEWYKKAKGKFAEYKDVKPFATEEINRARTYLTDTYSQLDIYFDSKIEELWRKISQRILACTGSLLEETPIGQETLEKFLQLLEGQGIGDPFPSLREATAYLLKCGTENAIFQSHLLPRLIEETEKLEPETLNFPGISYQDEQAPEQVLKIISLKIIQTSFAVQRKLKDSPFVSNILYSAAVKFEDSLVRSKDVDEQFFDFASLYKNEIWAGEFQSLQKNHAMVKRTEQAITNLKQLLGNSLQG